MPQRKRSTRKGRPSAGAAPLLLCLAGVTTVFTLAAVVGAGGHWRLVHFVFAGVTTVVGGFGLHQRQRRRLAAATAAALVAEPVTPRAWAPQPDDTAGAAVSAPVIDGSFVEDDRTRVLS